MNGDADPQKLLIDSDEPIPAPVKKSRAPRKAAKTPIVEDDDDMEEEVEEALESKKGRKKTGGKGSKDHVRISG